MAKQNKSKRNIVLGIFVVLIIVVLMFYLASSVRLGGAVIGTSCIAKSDYLCQNPSYQYTTATIFVTLGQNTGTSWTSANFVFVPQGTNFSNSIPKISFTSYPANTTYAKNGTKSGETLKVLLPVNGVNIPVIIGTIAQGSIWAQYTTAQNKMPEYVEIATINIKAS